MKKPVTQISLWKLPCQKTYDKVWENCLKTPLKNPVKKPWNKFWENCLRNTSGKLYENTCEQKMKWNEMKRIEKNEIDNKNLQRHTANNEGINNMLYLYNYLTCL